MGNKILIFLLLAYLVYCQDEMLFYHTENKYCKIHKHNCNECDCWSCRKYKEGDI